MKITMVAYTTLALGEPWSFGLDESGYVMHTVDDDTQPIINDADELAEAAGRICYQSFNRPNPKTATNEGYLANIIDHGHFSVLEHASVSFYVEGVSRALLLELERHRFLSFSVVSQRYVDHSDAKFVMPPAIEHLIDEVFDQEFGGWTWREAITDQIEDARATYHNLVDHLTSRGLDRKTARGAARSVLPEGTEVKMIVTGNLRCWRDIMGKRNSEHADQEIREFAQEILRQLKTYAPNSFQDME